MKCWQCGAEATRHITLTQNGRAASRAACGSCATAMWLMVGREPSLWMSDLPIMKTSSV